MSARLLLSLFFGLLLLAGTVEVATGPADAQACPNNRCPK
jgi:hypothetical protein